MSDPIERMYDEAFAEPKDASDYLIVSGNPVDGFEFTGPFTSHDAALAYAEARGWSEGWWIASMAMPDVEE